MRSGILTNTRQSLRRRSPAKWKHIGMMGTPVWCLPWALQCLSVLSGHGCSGRPGRVGNLGYPVDRTPWASPARGQQCLSEWLAAGDLTRDGGWWGGACSR
ncbi:hypothetical protein TIFTF001_026242 [Ficus carica]|uniref:Uncharacterized protein n=1 Tax=Ficus carica TaxID=3494 RepID=A0AA88IXS1_FICCA|nr:hypothetical protein TIFTF001_026242 [Ficus carica]